MKFYSEPCDYRPSGPQTEHGWMSWAARNTSGGWTGSANGDIEENNNSNSEKNSKHEHKIPKKKLVRNVYIRVKELGFETEDQDALDKLFEGISKKVFLFADIKFAPGIPLYRRKEDEKPEIGYTCGNDAYVPDPKAPVYFIKGNEYKMYLPRNCDFDEQMAKIARMLCRCQGRSDVLSQDLADVEPNLFLKFASSRLEERVRRI